MVTRKHLFGLANWLAYERMAARPQGLIQSADAGRRDKVNFVDLRALVMASRKYYAQAGWTHVRQVARHAQELVGRELTLPEYAAVLFHDSSCRDYGQDGHHARSAGIANTELSWLGYAPAEIMAISRAIREHRSSFKGAFSSPLAELLSSADRDPPDTREIAMRCVAYRLGKVGGKPAEAEVLALCEDAANFIRAKYGSGSSTNLPGLYLARYKDELISLLAEADQITGSKIRQWLEATV